MANNAATTQPTITVDDELWAAVKESNESKVKELLAKGANPSYEQYNPGVWGASHRESVIHVALMGKPLNKTIIQILLDAGANPNANYEDYNWKGSGASNSAFQMALQYSIYSKDAQLLEMFLATKKADINLKSESSVSTMRYDGSSSWYPIHTATRGCFYEGVKLLLEHGAQPDAIATNQGQSEYGQGSDTVETSLHIVCGHTPSTTEHGYTNDDICNTSQALLEHGANVNAVMQRIDCLNIKEDNSDNEWQDPRSGHYVSPYRQVPVKETPLHIALLRNNTRLALLLLRHGADHNIPWIYGTEKVPCVNLMPGDMMSSFWSPENHQYFPKDVQKRIKTVLLCANRKQWKVPKELLYEIIKYSLYSSKTKNDWSMDKFLAQQKIVFQAEQKERLKERANYLSAMQTNDTNQPSKRARSKTLPEKVKSKCTIS
mmetsp:Transcript_760/g.1054  ORF Transcript_760/g.1054 Transcript_760/m.1054 type:complete len:433 (+) Transcript_760:60-1358(+)